MKELQLAADRLRESIQAMAQRPVGQSRNEAIKEVHAALFQTQQAMGLVPGPMASFPGAPDVTGGGKAAGDRGMQQGSGGASAGVTGMQQGGAGGK